MKTVFLSLTCLLLISLEIRSTTAKVLFSADNVEQLAQELHSLVRHRRSVDNETEIGSQDVGTWDQRTDADTDTEVLGHGEKTFKCHNYVSIDGFEGHVKIGEPTEVSYPLFCGVIKIQVIPTTSLVPMTTRLHIIASEETFGPRDQVLGGKCTTKPTPLTEKLILKNYSGMKVVGMEICGCTTDLCNGD